MSRMQKRNQKRLIAVIRKGKTDVSKGRVAPYERTARWLRSWGTKRELPPPSWE